MDWNQLFVISGAWRLLYELIGQRESLLIACPKKALVFALIQQRAKEAGASVVPFGTNSQADSSLGTIYHFDRDTRPNEVTSLMIRNPKIEIRYAALISADSIFNSISEINKRRGTEERYFDWTDIFRGDYRIAPTGALTPNLIRLGMKAELLFDSPTRIRIEELVCKQNALGTYFESKANLALPEPTFDIGHFGASIENRLKAGDHMIQAMEAELMAVTIQSHKVFLRALISLVKACREKVLPYSEIKDFSRRMGISGREVSAWILLVWIGSIVGLSVSAFREQDPALTNSFYDVLNFLCGNQNGAVHELPLRPLIEKTCALWGGEFEGFRFSTIENGLVDFNESFS